MDKWFIRHLGFEKQFTAITRERNPRFVSEWCRHRAEQHIDKTSRRTLVLEDISDWFILRQLLSLIVAEARIKGSIRDCRLTELVQLAKFFVVRFRRRSRFFRNSLHFLVGLIHKFRQEWLVNSDRAPVTHWITRILDRNRDGVEPFHSEIDF